ncbi:hypothetical protein MKZ38_007805 [Zalerion maritima]|uniref:Uncharacterized protein n=1 Tax=Zalerion maritima TaxID=339359 RepID=A0AAD5RI84_9PEZI|nr:hypothetical protein MKZ38_007805 [Zalerion maritima]
MSRLSNNLLVVGLSAIRASQPACPPASTSSTEAPATSTNQTTVRSRSPPCSKVWLLPKSVSRPSMFTYANWNQVAPKASRKPICLPQHRQPEQRRADLVMRDPNVVHVHSV